MGPILTNFYFEDDYLYTKELNTYSDTSNCIPYSFIESVSSYRSATEPSDYIYIITLHMKSGNNLRFNVEDRTTTLSYLFEVNRRVSRPKGLPGLDSDQLEYYMQRLLRILEGES